MINVFVSAMNCIVFILLGCHNVLMGFFFVFCGCFSYIPTRPDKPWAPPSQAHWQRNGRSLIWTLLGLRTLVFSLQTDLLNAKKTSTMAELLRSFTTLLLCGFLGVRMTIYFMPWTWSRQQKPLLQS
jgi:hypothetical protein